MNNRSAAVYGRAFVEILFLHPKPDNLGRLNLVSRLSLYFLALAFFYVPIIYFAVQRSAANHELIPYFLVIGVVHILSKVMLHNSKRVQKHFSTIKSRKNFLLRIWLVIEYVVFMWLVYLFYPLTCVLVPFSLLGMSFESMLGYDAFINLFSQNPEQFIMFGGIASYILFILADGYKKLKSGFLPDYLGLYALLSIVSASAEGNVKRLFAYWNVDISDVTSVLYGIFSISNRSMNIIASAMTVFFAVYSLYTNCGAADEEKTGGQGQAEAESIKDIPGAK